MAPVCSTTDEPWKHECFSFPSRFQLKLSAPRNGFVKKSGETCGGPVWAPRLVLTGRLSSISTTVPGAKALHPRDVLRTRTRGRRRYVTHVYMCTPVLGCACVRGRADVTVSTYCARVPAFSQPRSVGSKLSVTDKATGLRTLPWTVCGVSWRCLRGFSLRQLPSRTRSPDLL